MHNCTIAQNTNLAGNGGPGWGLFGHSGSGGDSQGAGVAFATTIVNCTISGNFGSGGFSQVPGFQTWVLTGSANGSGLVSGTTTIQNTIVAKNANVFWSGFSAATGPNDVALTASSQGHNFIGSTNGSSGWVTSDLTGSYDAPLDPRLGPLTNNGGPTFTMALLPGSPAIDQGNSAGASTDQRGRLRPVDNPGITNASGGDGSDIGAFELQSPEPVFTGLQKSGSDIRLNFLSEVGQNYRVERTDSLAPTNWITVADNLPGSGSIVEVIDPGGANQPARFYRGRTSP